MQPMFLQPPVEGPSAHPQQLRGLQLIPFGQPERIHNVLPFKALERAWSLGIRHGV